MQKLNNTMSVIGATGHGSEPREENDYYATDPKAVNMLLAHETFSHLIWEPSCGEGHISEALKKHGYSVVSSDLIDRGYPGAYVLDFLNHEELFFRGDIVTNPPYKYAMEFVLKALESIGPGCKVAMLLKVTFLAGKARGRELYKKYPPKTVYVCSERVSCAKNGDFEKYGRGGAIDYAWYVWQKGWDRDPVIKWIREDDLNGD